MNTGSIPPPNPLTYEGQVAVPFIVRPFPPQSSFNKFPVPCFWIDNNAANAYIQVAKPLGIADWVLLGGSPGALNTITTPDSTVVVPVAANINFLNGSGMTITGSGNNITFSSASSVAQEYDTDSGNAVPSADILKILGTSVQGLSTSGSGNTVTLTNADWTTSQKGVGVLSTNAQSIAGTGTTQAVTPASLGAKLGTQTAHSLLVSEGTNSALTALGAATNGQIPIGSTGADPVLATITSSDSTLTVTNGPGTINIVNGQPISFVAGVSATQSNVTGDVTFYTIIFDTINQDDSMGSYNNATGIFTCPKDGYYTINTSVLMVGVNSTGYTDGKVVIVVNTNQIAGFRAFYGNISNDALWVPVSTVYYLHSGDSVKIAIQVLGGTKTISILGTVSQGSNVSHFSCTRL